jgi:hypothetical protein
MQTFLPLPDFNASAACLDNKRLGKQRVECLQILNALNKKSKGWTNHPATVMWTGHTIALQNYMAACITEWIRRGFNNTMPVPIPYPLTSLPAWFGDDRLHSSHRSNLLRKDPNHYGQFNWTDNPATPYWWPSKETTHV